MSLITNGVSCLLGMALIEKPTRHAAMSGYFTPKALEILINLLQNRGLYTPTKFAELLTLFITCAIIGLGKSRSSAEKFDGMTGYLWN